MRAGPGTSESRIAWLGLGDVVQIVDGPFLNGTTDWWLISDGSITAYVFGGYLATASELDIDAPAAEETVIFVAGDTVIIALGSGGANIRDDATADGELMGTISEGVVLSVIDGPSYDADGAPWYLLDISEISDDTRGFVIGEALALTDVTVTSGDEAADDTVVAAESTSGATGSFVYPLAEYRISQGYGCTTFNFYPYNETLGCPWHNGVDMAAPLGTPLLASDGGTIKYAGWCDCALGLYVEIDHGNGYSTIYGHMNAVYVDLRPGDRSTRGYRGDRQHRVQHRPAHALHGEKRRHGREPVRLPADHVAVGSCQLTERSEGPETGPRFHGET